MAKSLTNSELGLALGVTAQRISVLRKEGMPTDSIDAAKAWREARANVQRAQAPKAAPAQLDDGTLADTIADTARWSVGRVACGRRRWKAATRTRGNTRRPIINP